MDGKYSFSNDVIFNKNLSGCLGVPRSVMSSESSSNVPSITPCLLRDRPGACTLDGQVYDEVFHLKALWKLEWDKQRVNSSLLVDGGAHVAVDGDTFFPSNGVNSHVRVYQIFLHLWKSLVIWLLI